MGSCPACGAGVAAAVLTPPPTLSATSRTSPAGSDGPTIARGTESATIFTAPTDDNTTFGSGEQPTLFAGETPSLFGAPDQPTMAPGLDASGQTFGGDSTTGGGGVNPSDHGPLSVGQVFGTRYHIIRLLGIGGMGAVYQAWDAELSVAVAIKVIRPEVMADPTAAADIERRFKRELLLARQVTHKNVVRIHDLGEIDGIKYITMAYVNGADLATVIRKQGRVPVAKTLRVARSVVSGLVAAHTAGVVHRDLKPANIMVDAQDEALIMDFGIARSTAEPVARRAGGGSPSSQTKRAVQRYTDATAVGAIIGTVEYMAPEQAKGQEVDQRADVYAFGLILYDMLAGRRRAEVAGSAFGELQARMETPPPPVKSLVPEVPDALDQIVSRCVEPDREKRFQSTAEVAAELDRLDENGESIPIKRVVGMRVFASVVVLALALLGGGWWYASRLIPAAQHEQVSVLIANFDNRTKDAAFEGSLEQTLQIAIEAASFVTTYNRDDARKVIGQLKLGTALDESTARLLAMREGIKVILAGSIQASGSGYSVTIRAVNPSDGATIASSSATASAKNDVLQRIGTAAARIRKALGDTTPDSERLAASETVTAASLDAVREYSQAQDLLYGGKDEEAIVAYRRAIEKDPKLARAYSGWGISATNLGRREEAAEAYKKALSLLDRMTDREKYRMLGTYNLQVVRNFNKAIEDYSTLLNLYPYDRTGHGNLALAYFYTRNFSKALEEGRQSIDNGSRDLLFRNNYALYAMYAGDFKAAADEARTEVQMDASLMKAYLPLAIGAIARGDSAATRDAYERMAKTGVAGASLANLGLADLAMYEGRFADAVGIVKAAISEDEKVKNTSWIAAKQVVMGEALLAQGKTAPAVAAARSVLKMMGREPVSVLAAKILARAGNEAEARTFAADLGRQLQPESRAYGKIIEGDVALRQGRMIDAVEAFLASQKLVDLWLGRLGLGIAYVQAEHYTEGLQELELCQKRIGEATAIFLDDLPSFRYAAPLSYWLARAQDGVGLKPTAATNYKKYLATREQAPSDPLAADARKRLNVQ